MEQFVPHIGDVTRFMGSQGGPATQNQDGGPQEREASPERPQQPGLGDLGSVSWGMSGPAAAALPAPAPSAPRPSPPPPGHIS